MDHWDLRTRKQRFIGSPYSTLNEYIKVSAQQQQRHDLRNPASLKLSQSSGYYPLCEGVSQDIDRPAKPKRKRPIFCSNERTLDSCLDSSALRTGDLLASNDEPQRHPTSSVMWDESDEAIYQSNLTSRHSTIYNKVKRILEK